MDAAGGPKRGADQASPDPARRLFLQAVNSARSALITQYGERAKTALPLEQMPLLIDALRHFHPEVIAAGTQRMMGLEENVWPDGQSVPAVLAKHCRAAKSEIVQKRAADASASRATDWEKDIDQMTSEGAAISRRYASLLGSGRLKEAIAFSSLSREQKIASLSNEELAEGEQILRRMKSRSARFLPGDVGPPTLLLGDGGDE